MARDPDTATEDSERFYDDLSSSGAQYRKDEEARELSGQVKAARRQRTADRMVSLRGALARGSSRQGGR